MTISKPTILLTGFPGRRMEKDNFQNPTGIIAKSLHGEQIGDYTIDSAVIDCELEERYEYVQGLFAEPRILALSLGMADIRGFKLERTARNVIDTATNPTQLGGRRRHPIQPRLPEDYERLCNVATPNLVSITKSLQQAGLEAIISDNAGTLGCNAAAFALYDLPATYDYIPRLFMHVPLNPECAAQARSDTDGSVPEMKQERIEEGVVIALAGLALLVSQAEEIQR